MVGLPLHQLPAIFTAECAMLMEKPCLLEFDLLTLQSDYQFLLSPELPIEASSIVRLVGSRVSIVQANGLSAVAAATRPSATRQNNVLLYRRGFDTCPSSRRTVLIRAHGPPQVAANPPAHSHSR